MNISEISIKRPVTIIMLVLIIIVLGVVSFFRIPIDLMPTMNLPMAIVITSYQGVGPQEVENFVTKNVESALATVNNMKSIQSQTSEGSSIVIVEFNDGTDMDFATLQMREKLDLIRDYLPDGVESPMVIKMDPNMLPAAQISVSSTRLDDIELKRIVDDTVKARMERLDGVASVSVTGGIEREIKVELDPVKMQGYGVNFSQVISILQMENSNLPGGNVEYGNRNLIIKSKGEFTSVDSIKNVPITLPQGNIVYLQDIARIIDGYKEQTTYTRANNEKSIGLSIQKQTTANTVKVVNLINKEIEKLKMEFTDIEINTSFDQGEYIEESISSVVSNIIIGAILSILILFVFLRNIRSTMIIGISIPISIIATFVLMFLTNTTVNIISMGGLALGVGSMVDNSIVVVENIFSHRLENKGRIQAAIEGTKEVAGAILASTLTNVVVFVPIIFTEGIAAQIFKQMALTVTISQLVSLGVALTLVPMLSSKMLKISREDKTKKNLIDNIFYVWERFFNSLDEFYRKVLAIVLKRRLITVVIVTIVFALSMALIPFVGVEFIAPSDQGQFTVDIELAQGAQLEDTDEVTKKVEEIISEYQEVTQIFVTVGGGGSMLAVESGSSNGASISTTLVPKNERKKSTTQIVEEIREKVSGIPGADIKVNETSMMSMGGAFGGAPVSIEISGYDFDQLKTLADEVVLKVKEVEGTRQVESSISDGKPEAQIYVDRQKASQYGLSTMQVASAIRMSLQGQVATRYRIEGDEIDVRVSLPEGSTKTYEQLKSVAIQSPTGANLLLGDLAEIALQEGPTSITRKNQTRYVTVSAELFNRDTGSANTEISEKLSTLNLPDGYSISYGGESQQIADSFRSLAMALMLSVLLIYMVMAAQFESLLQPFVIMFTIPLAFAEAVLGLAVTGRSLNVASFIGIIMLAGLVVNNAIVLLDYVNQLRGRGMERNEAIIKAGPSRLRPILMTMLTTVLGMIPLALGIGEGAEIQAPLATVVLFGLLLSTVLTLLVIPVIYTLFDDLQKRFSRKNKRASQITV
ncbi:MAG: efflux RND transporter permease subunit [Clostridiaceae bacterium]|nr:efflux RND transporter permease subunit [Clostridiaceae bacterium]